MTSIRVGRVSNSVIAGGDINGNVCVKRTGADIFEPVRRTLEGLPFAERKPLLTALDELEHAQKPAEIAERYNAFVQAAANHMTLLQPFLPTLVDLLR